MDRAREYADADTSAPFAVRVGFELWLKRVDGLILKRAGVSLFDLPDAPLRDWFDAGVIPAVAAEDALREAGWGEGDEDETFDERVRG